MSRWSGSARLRYGLALAIVGVALGLSLVIRPIGNATPFLSFFLAAVAGWLGASLWATRAPRAGIKEGDVLAREAGDRKRTQQKLEATLTDLARSHRELERFASTVRHDAAQPLGAIMTYAELIREQSQGDVERYASRIVEVAARMAALVEARPDGSKNRLDPHALEPATLDPVIEDIRADLDGALVGRGVTVVSEGLPTVAAVPALMPPLFRSLISGTLKSWNGSCRRVLLSAKRNGETWIVSARVDGEAPAGFTKLGANDRALETNDDLAFTRQIVELHGGKLWIETDPDGAYAIRFTLPACDAAPPVPSMLA